MKLLTFALFLSIGANAFAGTSMTRAEQCSTKEGREELFWAFKGPVPACGDQCAIDFIAKATCGGKELSPLLVASCKAKADIALAAVAKALGMGKGIAHIGGSEMADDFGKLDSNGNVILTFIGGPLAPKDADGYISGSSATVKMVAASTTCHVESVSISTGTSSSNVYDTPSK